MRHRIVVACVALACCALACSGETRRAHARGREGTILIGEFQSLSGANEVRGLAFHRGLLRALEQCNASGGVLGRRVEAQVYDDRSSSADAALAVRRLIDEERAVVLVGASSLELLRAAAAASGEVPIVSPFGDGLVALDDEHWIVGAGARETASSEDEALGQACGALVCAAMETTRTFEPPDLWKALAAQRQVGGSAPDRPLHAFASAEQAAAFEAWTRARERARAAAAQAATR